jgi:hypothetical protein
MPDTLLYPQERENEPVILDLNSYALESTTTDPLVGDLAEPALDEIQPGTGSWNEVQMKPEDDASGPWLLSRGVAHSSVKRAL